MSDNQQATTATDPAEAQGPLHLGHVQPLPGEEHTTIPEDGGATQV
ncbi:hypothetical protein [Kitasatospora sp. LaBMicrA B282]